MTPLVQTPFLAQSFVFTSKTPPAHPPRRTSIIYTTSNDFRKLVHAKSLFFSITTIIKRPKSFKSTLLLFFRYI